MRAKEWWRAPEIAARIKPLMRLGDNGWSFCSQGLLPLGILRPSSELTKDPTPQRILLNGRCTGQELLSRNTGGSHGQEPGTTRQANENPASD